MSLTEANMRLAKAGGDVCRALGVYAESPEAAVVNELVRATQHQAAEHIRAELGCVKTRKAHPGGCYGSDCCATAEDAARLIDPGVERRL